MSILLIFWPACNGMKLCMPSTSENVWSPIFPVMFFPVFWVAYLIGFFSRGTAVVVPKTAVASEFATAISTALKQFKTGHPVTQRCSICASIILVHYAVQSNNHKQIHTTCECGDCEGVFEDNP
jgi:hypothetical protein